MTTNQTIDGVPRELVRENIAYLRGMDGTYDEKSALAAKFESLLLDPAPAKDLREQYEAWADANGYDIARNEHGDYAGIVEDSMWTGWQARGELRALLDAHVEPIPDDYVPLDGMFRLEETEEGMTYWLKAGGYKSRLYDFMASHPYLDFYGLKWEWNGDLKVAFRWNCAPELRISERVPIEENQETILGGVLPLVMVVRESNMPPGRIQAVSKPAAQPQGKPVAWRCVAAINGKHYITEESPDQQQRRIDSSEPGHYLFASEPLYLGTSEQPAPVAVHEEFEFCKWTHEVIEESRIGGVTIKIQRMQHLTPGEEKSAHDAWMARAALSTKSR